MKIIAFILGPKEIGKIIKHFGLPEYGVPPPIAPQTSAEPKCDLSLKLLDMLQHPEVYTKSANTNSKSSWY